MIILACISVIVSSALSVFYAYLAYKKSQEPPKDEIWETALALCRKDDAFDRSDCFARTYILLKMFKENGYSYLGFDSIADMDDALQQLAAKRKADIKKAAEEINTVGLDQS